MNNADIGPARNAVARAILAGKLVRQPCSRCGALSVDAHHEDYSKPLDVVWLCRKCHTLRHQERGDIKPRAKKRQQCAVLFPPDLITQVDAVAEQEEGSRSKMIEMLIRLGLQHWQMKEAA
jgi:ribosomal protein S27AE